MFKLVNLEEVREFLFEEIQADIDANKLYLSPRLTPKGKIEYPKFLKNAAKNGNIESFIEEMKMGFFNSHENYNRNGEERQRKVPQTANITLCEGEFNRFYIRAVCVKAIGKGENSVIAYRARISSNPRPESIAIENKPFDAKKLLNDLRTNPGVDTALGLPPGPNSGMSVKLIAN